MKKITRQELNEVFQQNREVIVTFTKKDGSERVMRCTKDLKVIPKEFHPKGDPTKKQNESVYNVFDLVAGGWRSFTIDNIISLHCGVE